MVAATLSGAVLAADDMSTEAIAERIAPVGQDYTAKELEGIATAGAAPVAAAPSGPRDGEAVYKGACFACHDMGIAGAAMASSFFAKYKPRLNNRTPVPRPSHTCSTQKHSASGAAT